MVLTSVDPQEFVFLPEAQEIYVNKVYWMAPFMSCVKVMLKLKSRRGDILNINKAFCSEQADCPHADSEHMHTRLSNDSHNVLSFCLVVNGGVLDDIINCPPTINEMLMET